MAPQDILYWSAFETTIAEFYRFLGAEQVLQDVSLAGHQVDVYVEERTTSGSIVRTAVECKFLRRVVRKEVVRRFANIARLLKGAGLIDKAVLVAYSSFTPEGISVARSAGIDLINFRDFEAKVISKSPGSASRIVDSAEKTNIPASFPDLIFVLMPFSEELDDLYIYGIRGCAQKHGLRCKRADEILHDNAAMDEVIDDITRARAIVADVSDHSPNVFYEVGWAHALRRPTILTARQGTELPFDIAHINILLYKNINDLEKKLTPRFEAIARASS